MKHRTAELVRRWAASSVSVSPVMDHRHWKLIDRLRGGRSWQLERVEDLAASVRAFAQGSDVVTAIGWDVEQEPPLLISTAALLRTSQEIASIYSDGFILLRHDTGQALMVDIDEQGVEATTVDLPV